MFVFLAAGAAQATPGGVDFRVRGGTAGWDAAIFTDSPLDQYGLPGDGGAVWGAPVGFTLNYSAATGLAEFAIADRVVLSHAFAPGAGFETIKIYGAATRDTKFDVPDDGSQIDVLFDGGPYQALTSGSWVETIVYSGSALFDISLSGIITFTNEVFAGSGDERLKAGVIFANPATFGGPEAVPVPGAVWLLGTGLLALVFMRKKVI